MKVIHLQVEQTRQSASRMQRSAVELSESCDALHRARRRLAGSWTGGGARHFDREFRSCLNQLEGQIEELDRLVMRMQREIDQWEAEDNNGLATLPGGFTFFSKQDRLQYGLALGWHIITGNVIGGIYTLFQIGQHWITDNQQQINDVILRSDETIDTYLRTLLGVQDKDATHKMRLSIDGEFTIPGAEVGVPGSFVLGKGKEFELIRNPDGTYTLYLEDNSKYGLEHDFTPNARLKFGSQEYKMGATAEAEAGTSPISFAAFTFDPQKPGDLTKMAALIGSVGISLPGALSMLPSVPAGPALYLLRDNLTEVGFAAKNSGEAELSGNALVKLAGVDLKGHVKQGGSMVKEDGKWKVTSDVEMGTDIKWQFLANRGGGEGDVKLQSIVDLETGQASSVVTVTLKGEKGAGLDPSVLKSYLPDGKSTLSMNVEVNQVNEVQITYRLDQSAETVRDMINGPDGFSIDHLLKNSSIEVKAGQGASATTGLGGEIAIGGGQELGFDLGGELTRSSQKTIYTYP